jgi:hypothetical protein
MTKLQGIDQPGLRKFYKESAAARGVLDHFAGRERDWSATPVDRLVYNVGVEGSEASRGDVIEVLRRLEALGCGRYVVGRRGHSSRFEWKVSMVSAGQYAAAERDDIAKLADDVGEEGESTRKHPFNLRRDMKIELELPVDLTPAEAERVAKFVLTLPLPQ